jgi:hypothetical protein
MSETPQKIEKGKRWLSRTWDRFRVSRDTYWDGYSPSTSPLQWILYSNPYTPHSHVFSYVIRTFDRILKKYGDGSSKFSLDWVRRKVSECCYFTKHGKAPENSDGLYLENLPKLTHQQTGCVSYDWIRELFLFMEHVGIIEALPGARAHRYTWGKKFRMAVWQWKKAQELQDDAPKPARPPVVRNIATAAPSSSSASRPKGKLAKISESQLPRELRNDLKRVAKQAANYMTIAARAAQDDDPAIWHELQEIETTFKELSEAFRERLHAFLTAKGFRLWRLEHDGLTFSDTG